MVARIKQALNRLNHLTSWPRALAMLLGFMLLIGAANLIVSTRYFNELQREVLAGCAFSRDIGTAPVTPAPGSRAPSRLAIEIVVHSRQAYYGRDCPGHLPPPSPQLVHWAKVYHIGFVRDPGRSVVTRLREVDKESKALVG